MNDHTSELNDLIRISRYAGMREDYVQSSGGNTSVKLPDGTMLIKGLGIQLADVSETFGWAHMRCDVFLEHFLSSAEPGCGAREEAALQERAFLSGCRPAIETYFHALTGPVTLHTHPTLVNVLTARKGGMQTLRALFPDAYFADYAPPGLPLGVAVWRALKSAFQPGGHGVNGVIFLKNHGVIVSGDTADEVIALHERVMAVITAALGCDSRADNLATALYTALERAGMAQKIVLRATNATVLRNLRYLEQSYVFCPDALVFCGWSALRLDEADPCPQLTRYAAEHGVPELLLWRDQLYVTADSVKKAKEIESVAAFCTEVLRLNGGYEMDLLSADDCAYLSDCESEKYRKTML